MVMADSSSAMAAVHDRMPVILSAAEWWAWQYGTPDQALELVRTWPGELRVERTREFWAGGRFLPEQPTLF